jgi:type IV pilus assembly protein PilE
MRTGLQKSRGFTLIELMIVVVIVAILLGIGLPAYQNQVIKSKRSVGKGELMKVAASQEQYFVNNKRYATDLADLGYADGADGYEVDAEGQWIADGSDRAIYEITLQSASTTAFVLQADPLKAQAKDTQCQTLTLSNTGVKGVTDSPTLSAADCW